MCKMIHSIKCPVILTNPTSPSKIAKDKLAKVIFNAITSYF